ncbi:GspH/FimT family pseudopilin [Hydrogenophaga sp. IBVHS2]|uniref:GspH/FimT family pseudopilin n=1 Tax=Hydrogenophaga sp. IBVHS2 TaxID=1985170 RepID=UPI000A321CF1|nr:GspH/FimT family pseudopilin [Hydrogenophaga sp. IBVHS2]
MKQPTTSLPTPPFSPASRGLSLIETMVAVAILGGLLAMAAPSFARIGERYRVSGVQQDLENSLHAARVEAINRNRAVTVRRIAGCPEATDPGDWRCGWESFIDRNRNHQRDPDEPPLSHHEAIPGHRILLEGPNRDSLTYSPLGRTEVALQSLTIVPDRPAGAPGSGQRLCLLYGGTRLQVIDIRQAC